MAPHSVVSPHLLFSVFFLSHTHSASSPRLCLPLSVLPTRQTSQTWLPTEFLWAWNTSVALWWQPPHTSNGTWLEIFFENLYIQCAGMWLRFRVVMIWLWKMQLACLLLQSTLTLNATWKFTVNHIALWHSMMAKYWPYCGWKLVWCIFRKEITLSSIVWCFSKFLKPETWETKTLISWDVSRSWGQ